MTKATGFGVDILTVWEVNQLVADFYDVFNKWDGTHDSQKDRSASEDIELIRQCLHRLGVLIGDKPSDVMNNMQRWDKDDFSTPRIQAAMLLDQIERAK